MPVIKSMMKNMVDQYGAVKGKAVYYGTEAKLRSQGKLTHMLAQAKKHNDLSKGGKK